MISVPVDFERLKRCGLRESAFENVQAPMRKGFNQKKLLNSKDYLLICIQVSQFLAKQFRQRL